jgi:DNA-binding CsgD family transcriptional regulator
MWSSSKIHLINHYVNQLSDENIYIVVKNENLNFIAANSLFAHQFGFERSIDLVGSSDEDFPWGEYWTNKYHHDDQQVLSGSIMKNYVEKQPQNKNLAEDILMSKYPLLNSQKKINGVIVKYKIVSSTIKLFDKLTIREMECLTYVTNGFSVKQIANILNLSKRTVESYQCHMYQKLNISNKAHLVERCWYAGVKDLTKIELSSIIENYKNKIVLDLDECKYS